MMRGQQIGKWLAEKDTEAFVILDDDVPMAVEILRRLRPG